MFSSIRSSFLPTILGLALAGSAVACGGTDGSDAFDSAQLAVKKQKDGKPTGNGRTCSWGGDRPVPVIIAGGGATGSTGSSSGCAKQADGSTICWSTPAPVEGEPMPAPAPDGEPTEPQPKGKPVPAPQPTPAPAPMPTPAPGPMPEPTPVPPPPPADYQLGDWFPSIDGCNTCTCSDLGIMCTVQVCDMPLPPPPPPGRCEIDGKVFAANGSAFPSPDGCNTCSCGPDGFIACTEMACAEPSPPPPAEKR